MSLKNLEKRFNEKVNQLYAGATSKFDNGKSSNAFNDDPLNVRRIGSESFGRASRLLGRSLPVGRAAQDTLRLTKFLASWRGIGFLAKQYLLQTGNTFEITRLLNPLFVLGAAAAPAVGNIVRIRRHWNPRNTLLSRTDTSTPNVKKLGQLQVTTYNQNFLNPTTNQFALGNLKPASPLNAKINIGQEKEWPQSRPELKDYIKTLHNSEPSAEFKYGGAVKDYLLGSFIGNRYGIGSGNNYSTYYGITDGYSEWNSKTNYTNSDYYLAVPGMNEWDTMRTDLLSETSVDTSLVNRQSSISQSLEDQKLSFPSTERNLESTYLEIANFNGLSIPSNNLLLLTQQQENYQILYKSGNDKGYLAYFSGSDAKSVKGALRLENTNAKDIAGPQTPNTNNAASYLRDPANTLVAARDGVLDPYKTLPSDKFDDPIVVSFAMGRDRHIQFRAFITDLNQSISPEYKTNQYIGRMEKFVSYTGVQRELSFKLGVLAFSKDELAAVWNRINYLTGLAFPYSIRRGILQPNIIRLTIGNLFTDQPGYVTSLSTNFNQITESWDIDKGVPISAQVDIKFIIIEKRTALASSPFYAING